MRTYIPAYCAIIVCIGLAAPSASAQVAEREDGERLEANGKIGDADNVDAAKAADLIVNRTNQFRKNQNLDSVTVSPDLTKAAQYFADYMARTNQYGHGADGKRPSQRAKEHGYQYCIVSENIAYQYNSAGFETKELARKFTQEWKESPGHRKNMLDEDVTETGVAIARSDKTGYYYAVQMFGRPKSASYSFRVRNGAGETVHYTIGERKFELPPRYTRTHTRCRSTELTFALPSGQQKSVQPSDGDLLLVESGTDGVRIQRK